MWYRQVRVWAPLYWLGVALLGAGILIFLLCLFLGPQGAEELLDRIIPAPGPTAVYPIETPEEETRR
jgi:hypothetical protein